MFDKNFLSVPRKSPNGDHVSLFLIVSASRSGVTLYVVIHKEQDPSGMCVDTWMDKDKVRVYHLEDGYMQQSTFCNIMKDVFIPDI